MSAKNRSQANEVKQEAGIFSHGIDLETARREARQAWLSAATRALPSILDIAAERLHLDDCAALAGEIADAVTSEFVDRFCPEHMEKVLHPDFPGLGDADDDDEDEDEDED